MIDKALGDHIARGMINETDGLVSKISENGHFDLHEFEGAELNKKFRVICSV